MSICCSCARLFVGSSFSIQPAVVCSKTVWFMVVLNRHMCVGVCVCWCQQCCFELSMCKCVYWCVIVCLCVILSSRSESEIQAQIQLCANRNAFSISKMAKKHARPFSTESHQKYKVENETATTTRIIHIKYMCKHIQRSSGSMEATNQTRQHYLYCAAPIGMLCEFIGS